MKKEKLNLSISEELKTNMKMIALKNKVSVSEMIECLFSYISENDIEQIIKKKIESVENKEKI